MTRARATRIPFLLATLTTLIATGCADQPAPLAAPALRASGDVVGDTNGALAEPRIVVDAAQPIGPVIRFEQASTHSTSSPLPGEATRAYLQSLDESVVRTWIQVRYVYNNGNVDYNYPYESSGVGAEDALRFYAPPASRSSSR
ncbi:MAG TPA: hypothetical protein VH539_21880 [Gemmatimonadaceae bacterium]